MSTQESKRNPSQAKPQSREPANSIPPKAQHSTDNRKPLPFDDDDTGDQGEVVKTTNPTIEDLRG